MLSGAYNIRPATIHDATRSISARERNERDWELCSPGKFVHKLATRGLGSMAVWVLELSPSRKFYEYLGGKVIAQQPIARGCQTFIEVAYGWQSLTVFL